MHEVIHSVFRHAESNPDQPAVIGENGTTGYGALARQVLAMAAALEQAPQIVGLMMPRTADWIAADLALAILGRTVVPLPDFFAPGQLAHVLADSGAGAVVASDETAERAATLGVPVLVPRPAEGGWRAASGGARRIIYTSGTTGRPKGVVLGEAQLSASLAGLADAVRPTSGDRHLSVLPFSLLLEQICGLYLPLQAGATIFLCADPQRLPVAAEWWQPTTTVLVPELLAGWVRWLTANDRPAPASLRFVAAGGAPIPGALAEAAWKAGLPVYEGYGLSECCSVVAVNRSGDRLAGTVGHPLAGVDIAIEDGEIVVRGDTVMERYLGGERTSGVWRTGDLGHLDGDGRLVVMGRKDDVIVTSRGRNINPEWIEPMLLADPRISRCAVVAGTDAPRAAVVASPQGAVWFGDAGSETITDHIRALCAEAPEYARPSSVTVLSPDEARALGLFTPDGRPRRRAIHAYLETRR